MNPATAITLEVQSLIEAVCDGIADDAQVRDPESLLLTDEEMCTFYVDLLNLDAELQWLAGSLQEGDAAVNEFVAAEQTVQQSAPTFPTSSSLFHPTLGYSSGWTTAYLSATVITGLLILGFWLMPVPCPEQVAKSVPPSAPVVVEPKAYVGRITGMVDCKISDSRVSLGQKLDLASGLMEITYDTGAKVILQGPATYSVETNGGYLAVGKLTGKLERKVASGQWSVVSVRNLHLHPSPLAPPFSIHTPTVTVSDLGTEFGVEVTPNQRNHVHVFQGKVVVRTNGGTLAASAGITSHEIELTEGEAADVKPEGVIVRLSGPQARTAAHTIGFMRNSQEDAEDPESGRHCGRRRWYGHGPRPRHQSEHRRDRHPTAAFGRRVGRSRERRAVSPRKGTAVDRRRLYARRPPRSRTTRLGRPHLRRIWHVRQSHLRVYLGGRQASRGLAHENVDRADGSHTLRTMGRRLWSGRQFADAGLILRFLNTLLCH